VTLMSASRVRSTRLQSPEGGTGRPTPIALSIAGSDSGGGAGIEADLKAFARCGVHGTCAITAVTAQNTTGVSAIHPVPPSMVLAQVRAVVADMGVDAVKVGMLGSARMALAVAGVLDELEPGTPVVVDPVMVAASGARLLDPDARGALLEQIVSRATVLTPNLDEARVLAGASSGAGREAGGEDAEAGDLVRALLALGPRAVVLTGGHRERAVDLFLEAGKEGTIVEIPGPRHPAAAHHGSGCTHSAVLAAELGLGSSALDAARRARALAALAIAQGLADTGAGSGPVDIVGIRGQRGRKL
jgi:hydroxymethylpyrimidine/phosphomethylpyrimidine kinase